MTPEEQQLEAGIAALEGQRDLLGDAIVESALAPMRARRRSARGIAARRVDRSANLDAQLGVAGCGLEHVDTIAGQEAPAP